MSKTKQLTVDEIQKISTNAEQVTSAVVDYKAGRKSGIIMVSGAIVLSILMVIVAQSSMPREAIGGILLIMMLGLMVLNVPVGIAMAVTGLIGVWSLAGSNPAETLLAEAPFNAATNFSLTVIPMFVFMGLILWRSGITADLYAAAKHWLSWLPGGLAITTNLAGAGLGAASGSTIGITYALGRIGIPEMLRAGYDKRLATGSIMSAGTIGQLIPPSILLVLFAGFAEIPVGPQLMAGIIPGLALTLMYALIVITSVLIKPHWAPRQQHKATRDWGEVWRDSLRCWPIPAIAFIIIGGMFSGMFTATEAGAVGALAALIFAYGRMGFRAATQATRYALRDTLATVGGIMLVLIGATILNRFLALSGTAQLFADAVIDAALPTLGFVAILTVFYLILGMFMDPIAMMLLTVPILLPAAEATGISPVWFGVFVVLMGEIAILSPPVGMLAFITHKLTHHKSVNMGHSITLIDVFKGALLFIPGALAVVLIMSLLPELATWLPSITAAQ